MKRSIQILLMTVITLSLIVSSCTKELKEDLKSVKPQEPPAYALTEVYSTSAITAKGKKDKAALALSTIPNDTIRNDAQALVVRNAFEIYNPSVGVLGFDNPTVAAGEEFRWSFIAWGDLPTDTTFTMDGQFSIWQTSWIWATGNPLNPFVNGSGQVVYTVPSGTHAARVVNVIFEPTGRVREYHSWVRPGFQF